MQRQTNHAFFYLTDKISLASLPPMLKIVQRGQMSQKEVGKWKNLIESVEKLRVASVRKGWAYQTYMIVFQKVKALTIIASKAPLILTGLLGQSERITAEKANAISARLSQD